MAGVSMIQALNRLLDDTSTCALNFEWLHNVSAKLSCKVQHVTIPNYCQLKPWHKTFVDPSITSEGYETMHFLIGRLQILRLPFLNENMKTIGFFKVPVLTQYLLSSLPKHEKQLRVHQNALMCMRTTWYPTIIQISTSCNDYGMGYVWIAI